MSVPPTSEKAEPEPRVQLTMKVRQSLRDELRRVALEKGMTIQAFVMNALKAQGLHIVDADLIDQRSRPRT